MRVATPVRGGAELAMSLKAIAALVAGVDARCRLLALDGLYAVRANAPGLAAGIEGWWPGPVLNDAPAAIERAGRAAAGDLPWHASLPGDAGRIVGRGAEEWLAWAFLAGYPLPVWLVPGMPAEEVHRGVLGGVGCPLDRPTVSNESFVYDVADHLSLSGHVG